MINKILFFCLICYCKLCFIKSTSRCVRSLEYLNAVYSQGWNISASVEWDPRNLDDCKRFIKKPLRKVINVGNNKNSENIVNGASSNDILYDLGTRHPTSDDSFLIKYFEDYYGIAPTHVYAFECDTRFHQVIKEAKNSLALFNKHKILDQRYRDNINNYMYRYHLYFLTNIKLI